jgi:hypothetical protein
MEATTDLYRPLAPSEGRLLSFEPNTTTPGSLHLILETISWDDEAEVHLAAAASSPSAVPLSEPPCSAAVGTSPPSSCQLRYRWGDYAALSYVWGDDPSDRLIYINGLEFKVRTNLEAALRSLAKDQLFQGNFKIWIDALCINQDDLDERSVQVTKMKDIYTKAWNVVAWLGPARDESPKAFQLLHILYEHREKSKAEELKNTLLQNPGCLGEGLWLALQELVIRPYWSRVWIMQEVTMGSKRVIIRCGDDAMLWNTFIMGISCLHDHFWQAKDRPLAQDRARKGLPSKAWNTRSLHMLKKDLKPLVEGQTSNVEQDRWTSLSRLVDISASCNSTKRRDKVYGMLGMMNPMIAAQLKPDYQKKLDEVFLDTALAGLVASSNLDFLRDANLWPPANGPTWVPDWTWRWRNRDGRFWSTFKTSLALPADFQVSGRKLRCRGIIIDEIDGLGARKKAQFSYQEDSFVQPKFNMRPYGNFAETQFALTHALTGDGTWTPRNESGFRRSIIYLPKTYKAGLSEFKRRNWRNFMLDRGYYHTWQGWREANGNLMLAGQPMDDYFSDCIPSDAIEDQLWQAKGHFTNCQIYRRFAISKRGLFGWVPDFVGLEPMHQVIPGDVVAIIYGCSTPLLLRRRADGYAVVGEAYFLGLMAGEAANMLQKGVVDSQMLNLI